MPLKPGYSKATFNANVVEMLKEGKHHKQALAIAYKSAVESFFKKHPKGALPAWLVPPGKSRMKKNPSPTMTAKAKRLYEDFSGHKGQTVAKTVKPVVPDTMMVLGTMLGVAYEAVRDGKREKYFHEFARKSQPLLCVSPDGDQLFIIDGNYKVTDHGIVDS